MSATLTTILVPFLAVCLAVNTYATNPALKFRPDGSFCFTIRSKTSEDSLAGQIENKM